MCFFLHLNFRSSLSCRFPVSSHHTHVEQQEAHIIKWVGEDTWQLMFLFFFLWIQPCMVFRHPQSILKPQCVQRWGDTGWFYTSGPNRAQLCPHTSRFYLSTHHITTFHMISYKKQKPLKENCHQTCWVWWNRRRNWRH